MLTETARKLQIGARLVEEGVATEKSTIEPGLKRLGDRRFAAIVRKENSGAAELLPKISSGLKEQAKAKTKSSEQQ